MRVLWFVLLLSSAAIATQKEQSWQCAKKNDFLQTMVTAKPLSVFVFGSPQKSATESHCRYEWSQSGTCCKEHDLKVFYELEVSLIDLNHKYLTKVVTDAAKLIGRSEDFKGFEKDSKTCWNHMKKVRGSALCSICSGRSEHFFKEGKALVSPETCMEAVETCDKFFKDLSDLANFLPKFMEDNKFKELNSKDKVELVDLSKDLKVYSPPQDLVQAFEKFDASKKDEKSSIAASLKVCSMVLNLRKTPYVLMWNKEGTENFLRLRNQQLDRENVENLITLKNKDKELAEKLKKEKATDLAMTPAKLKLRENQMKIALNRLKARQSILSQGINDKKIQATEDAQKLASNWEKEKEQKKSSERNLRLQSERNLGSEITTTQNLFTSDTTVLLPSDSMFSSFDGSKGTTLDNAHGFLRPMNMSLAFP